jgi:hypothetical protein
MGAMKILVIEDDDEPTDAATGTHRRCWPSVSISVVEGRPAVL